MTLEIRSQVNVPLFIVGAVTGSSLFSVRRCVMVDDRPFPLSETVYNTFVFGGRSVVSEHIGYYTDRKGNDIVLENNW